MGRRTKSVNNDEPLEEVMLELYAEEVTYPERNVQGIGTFRRGEPVKIDPRHQKALKAKGMKITTGKNLPKSTNDTAVVEG